MLLKSTRKLRRTLSRRCVRRQFFKVCARADALLSGSASLLWADRCLSGVWKHELRVKEIADLGWWSTQIYIGYSLFGWRVQKLKKMLRLPIWPKSPNLTTSEAETQARNAAVWPTFGLESHENMHITSREWGVDKEERGLNNMRAASPNTREIPPEKMYFFNLTE